MVRGKEPDCLAVGKAQWTADWVAAAPGKDFSWRSAPCKEQITTVLCSGTEQRCAYCSVWPMRPCNVDHFVPKTVDRTLAYDWLNLYPTCGTCNNSKRAAAPPSEVLRPDRDGYAFERFFLESDDGLLVANPAASIDEQQRAEATIAFFRLNAEANRKDRLAARRGKPAFPF